MIKNGKVYFPFQLPDFRMARPKSFLVENTSYVYQTMQTSMLRLASDKGIQFFTPNGVSMFHNKARKEYEFARGVFETLIKGKLKTGLVYVVKPEELGQLYDYFESIQTSIIMIYSAIEALCNVAIPEDYSISNKNSRGIIETLDKAAIEKWISTEEKVGKILPDILKVDSPKTLPLWENFKKLKDIRDQIIHLKQTSNKSSEIESAFLETLIRESIFAKIKAGFDIIEYYCEKDQTHYYFPMIANDIPIQVNIVEDIKQIPGYTKEMEELKPIPSSGQTPIPPDPQK